MIAWQSGSGAGGGAGPPAAAGAPVRNCVGSVQKLGSTAKIDMAVTEMTPMAPTGEPTNRATGIETPPMAAGTAMCQLRSPRRVTSLDQRYIARAANT